jgi:hypothetical protein
LLVGILSIAMAGCGKSNEGGVPAGGTGGTTGTGGPASGGTPGTGGSSVQAGTGGATGNGGTVASGGSMGTGGAQGTGGTVAGTGGRGTGGRSIGGTGGPSTEGTGGSAVTGGAVGTGGGNTGGLTGATGGAGTGGRTGTGGSGGTGAITGTGGTTGGKGGSTGTGTCTASKAAGVTVSGSGPHKVTVESNSDAGISCGTIYRPTDLGGAEKYPIFVWGEGACTRSGTSNQASMGEIASHGYFVVADGPVGSAGNCGSISMPSSEADLPNMAKPLLGYITWAIAENDKSCSAYYQSLDTTKVAADGFSCGGLMAEATAGDPRMTAWGVSSSGLTSPYTNFYKTIHTPVKILVGGSSDQANTNGARDYTNISALGIPIIFLSKTSAGHGGDLSNGKGDFNSVNLAWLNWQLKGDTTATGKGALYGSTCKYCTDSGWVYKSANIQ